MSDPRDAAAPMRSESADGPRSASPRRRRWRRRRNREPRRATVVFDSRRRADDERTRSGDFDPTDASRHLIYRLDDVDIAVSAYIEHTDDSVTVALTGHVLGPGRDAGVIVARQIDGTVLQAPVGPDGEFEIDLDSVDAVRLEHQCDGITTALGEIDLDSPTTRPRPDRTDLP